MCVMAFQRAVHPCGNRRSVGPRLVAPDIAAQRGVSKMMDILMLALGFAFFALAIGYTYACERL